MLGIEDQVENQRKRKRDSDLRVLTKTKSLSDLQKRTSNRLKTLFNNSTHVDNVFKRFIETSRNEIVERIKTEMGEKIKQVKVDYKQELEEALKAFDARHEKLMDIHTKLMKVVEEYKTVVAQSEFQHSTLDGLVNTDQQQA